MNKRLERIKYQRWALLWTVVILILCNIKMPDSDGTGFFFKGFDKVVHLGFFYVLTILLFYGKIVNQHKSYSFRSLTIFKIIVLTFCLGGAIELIQWKIFTYRSAEWWDLACDMIGVFMGVFSYVILHKWNYNEKKP
ncbi:VanZ family protein [Pedobacter sp. AW31-3R]|uniref:VanZ family protein n=1 Tax=Pedobacter sp. AW31-3R TaxID=3445781 RepID=UPI003FA11A82